MRLCLENVTIVIIPTNMINFYLLYCCLAQWCNKETHDYIGNAILVAFTHYETEEQLGELSSSFPTLTAVRAVSINAHDVQMSGRELGYKLFLIYAVCK